jgi:prenyltransferase, ubiA family
MNGKTIMETLRVRQWVKNLFVYVPLVFSGKMLNPQLILESTGAFMAFCLLASSIYIINDLRDRDADRRHPVKRLRPIASGRFPSGMAVFLSAALCAMSFAMAWGCGFTANSYLILAGYLVMNLMYSFGLKHIAILDVIIIAAGFVLRVLLGGVATHIWVTPWLVMMVFLLTLLIGFGKRRDDLIKMERDDVDVRKSVQEYNLTFINQVLGILAATVIVAYVSYTLTPEVEARFHSGNVYLTSVFVIGAVLRYLQIALVKERTGNPTQLVYSDRFIQICTVLWLASFLLIIYG